MYRDHILGAMAKYFSAGTFAFLRDLKSHNTRDWFLDHRATYVSLVETPMLQFINDAGPHLRKMSRAIVADPRRSGGSMYRIYRDTRFSHDKSPYKTHIAAHFTLGDRRQGASLPGFYLHIEPGGSLAGGGIYHPDPPTLAHIRLAIVGKSKAWAAVRETGLTLEGDRLTRAPAGFDPAHPFVDDLKQKDFYALLPFTQRQVCAANFLETFAATCERLSPLVAFLARATNVKW